MKHVGVMVLGKQVIASRLGGPSETITRGAGLLFDPGRLEDLAELLQRVLSGAVLRRTLEDGVRVQTAVFDIVPRVRAIEALYDRFLRGSPKGSS